MSSKMTCRLCGTTMDSPCDKCPLCGGSTTDDLLGNVPDEGQRAMLGTPASAAIQASTQARSTEDLETELRERSAAIERHQAQFQQVRAELKRRRETKDEQPQPELITEKPSPENVRAGENVVNVLTNKVIAMEAEQAKLVVEAEIARAAQREAEERLALVAKHIKRTPLTRYAAREIAVQNKIRMTGSASQEDPVADWVVEAIIEASK